MSFILRTSYITSIIHFLHIFLFNYVSSLIINNLKLQILSLYFQCLCQYLTCCRLLKKCFLNEQTGNFLCSETQPWIISRLPLLFNVLLFFYFQFIPPYQIKFLYQTILNPPFPTYHPSYFSFLFPPNFYSLLVLFCLPFILPSTPI